MSNHAETTKIIAAAVLLLCLLASALGIFVLLPREPQSVALAEGHLLGFGPDPHLFVTVTEVLSSDLDSVPGIEVRLEVRNTATGSFELSPGRLRLVLQDRAGSEVDPTSLVWRSDEKELLPGEKISANQVAQGTAIFQVAVDFEPAELVLWDDLGWAESIPTLGKSLLNPRLALPIPPAIRANVTMRKRQER